MDPELQQLPAGPPGAPTPQAPTNPADAYQDPYGPNPIAQALVGFMAAFSGPQVAAAVEQHRQRAWMDWQKKQELQARREELAQQDRRFKDQFGLQQQQLALDKRKYEEGVAREETNRVRDTAGLLAFAKGLGMDTTGLDANTMSLPSTVLGPAMQGLNDRARMANEERVRADDAEAASETLKALAPELAPALKGVKRVSPAVIPLMTAGMSAKLQAAEGSAERASRERIAKLGYESSANIETLRMTASEKLAQLNIDAQSTDTEKRLAAEKEREANRLTYQRESDKETRELERAKLAQQDTLTRFEVAARASDSKEARKQAWKLAVLSDKSSAADRALREKLTELEVKARQGDATADRQLKLMLAVRGEREAARERTFRGQLTDKELTSRERMATAENDARQLLADTNNDAQLALQRQGLDAKQAEFETETAKDVWKTMVGAKADQFKISNERYLQAILAAHKDVEDRRSDDFERSVQGYLMLEKKYLQTPVSTTSGTLVFKDGVGSRPTSRPSFTPPSDAEVFGAPTRDAAAPSPQVPVQKVGSYADEAYAREGAQRRAAAEAFIRSLPADLSARLAANYQKKAGDGASTDGLLSWVSAELDRQVADGKVKRHEDVLKSKDFGDENLARDWHNRGAFGRFAFGGPKGAWGAALAQLLED